MADEEVKYAVYKYGTGNPSNADWMSREQKGLTTTSATGAVEIEYTGAATPGQTVYVAIIRPDTDPVESMIWSDEVVE